MKPRIAVLVTCCLGFADTWAASFDCKVASSKVEKTICASDELSDLDERLASMYARALDSVRERSRLKAGERAWLAHERNACSNTSCLRAAYLKRISELETLAGLLPDSKGSAICEEVVKLANSGKLQTQFVSFGSPSGKEQSRYQQSNGYYLAAITQLDLYHTGHLQDIGRIQGGGTCSSNSVVKLGESDGRQRPSAVPRDPGEEDETYRWSSWGTEDELLFVLGEPVIVAADFYSRPAEITLVSSFRDGGPICSIKRGEPTRVAVIRSIDPALCNAVAKGTVRFNSWIEDESYMYAGNMLPYQVINIDSEGQPKTIAIKREDSGAGCGSSRSWLTPLKNDGDEANTPLNKALARFTGPLYPESDERIKTFQFRGKPYILARGEKTSLAVYSVWHSEPRTWCELDQVPTYLIEKRYTNANARLPNPEVSPALLPAAPAASAAPN